MNFKNKDIYLSAIALILLTSFVIICNTESLFQSFFSKGEELISLQSGFLLIIAILIFIIDVFFKFRKAESRKNFSFPVILLFFSAIFSILFWEQATLLWTQKITQYSAMNGYLPWSDASSYLFEGQHLSEKGLPLMEWSCRRPGHHLLMGFLSGVWQQNFEMILKSLVVLTGLICAFMSAVVAIQFGLGLGLLFGMGIFLFGAKEFIGLTLSGNIGLILSGFSFIFFIQYIQNKKKIFLGLGIFILALSLFARAGAFFILPALALVFALQLKPFKINWKLTLFGMASLIASFMINKAHRSIICPADTVANSNFSHTIYGITHGGKGWAYVKKDHPEWAKLSHKEFSEKVYNEAWNKFVTEPELAWKGLSKGFEYYYKYYMVVFTGHKDYEKTLLWVGFLIALISLFLSPSIYTRYARLSFATSIGIFLSAPFIAQDGGPRVFVSTLPFYLLTIIFPMSLLSLKKLSSREQVNIERSNKWLAGTFLFIFFSAPVWGMMSRSKLPEPKLQCAPGEQYVIQRYSPWLQIVLTDKEKKKYPYEVSPQAFHEYTSRDSHEAKDFLLTLESPTTILLGYDILDISHAFSIFKTDHLKIRDGKFVEYCKSKRAASPYFWEAYQ